MPQHNVENMDDTASFSCVIATTKLEGGKHDHEAMSASSHPQSSSESFEYVQDFEAYISKKEIELTAPTTSNQPSEAKQSFQELHNCTTQALQQMQDDRGTVAHSVGLFECVNKRHERLPQFELHHATQVFTWQEMTEVEEKVAKSSMQQISESHIANLQIKPQLMPLTETTKNECNVILEDPIIIHKAHLSDGSSVSKIVAMEESTGATITSNLEQEYNIVATWGNLETVQAISDPGLQVELVAANAVQQNQYKTAGVSAFEQSNTHEEAEAYTSLETENKHFADTYESSLSQERAEDRIQECTQAAIHTKTALPCQTDPVLEEDLVKRVALSQAVLTFHNDTNAETEQQMSESFEAIKEGKLTEKMKGSVTSMEQKHATKIDSMSLHADHIDTAHIETLLQTDSVKEKLENSTQGVLTFCMKHQPTAKAIANMEDTEIDPIMQEKMKQSSMEEILETGKAGASLQRQLDEEVQRMNMKEATETQYLSNAQDALGLNASAYDRSAAQDSMATKVVTSVLVDLRDQEQTAVMELEALPMQKQQATLNTSASVTCGSIIDTDVSTLFTEELAISDEHLILDNTQRALWNVKAEDKKGALQTDLQNESQHWEQREQTTHEGITQEAFTVPETSTTYQNESILGSIAGEANIEEKSDVACSVEEKFDVENKEEMLHSMDDATEHKVELISIQLSSLIMDSPQEMLGIRKPLTEKDQPIEIEGATTTVQTKSSTMNEILSLIPETGLHTDAHLVLETENMHESFPQSTQPHLNLMK
eukprot:Gb_08997 [translate_table: standard]